MATYASLSQTDKDALAAHLLVLCRAFPGNYKRSKDCEVINSDWNGGISAIVASLDAGEEIPNPTDYSGASAITKENLANNLESYISALADLGTSGHRGNMIPACGAEMLLADATP